MAFRHRPEGGPLCLPLCLPWGPFWGFLKVCILCMFSPLFWAVFWAVMEKKKGLLPLILPLIFPRGWPVCFASCAFRGGPRVVGPSGLLVASGPLWWLFRGFFRGFGFSFASPRLKRGFLSGFFGLSIGLKYPPPFLGFYHGKRQILGPEKQSQKQSQKDEKRGFLCAILCARKPTSSPWSGVSSRR